MSQEERDKAAEIPDGVQSGEHVAKGGCYVLLRHRDHSVALVRDRITAAVTRAPRDIGHETLVRAYAFANRTAALVEPPATFDDEISDVVRKWAATVDADLPPGGASRAARPALPCRYVIG